MGYTTEFDGEFYLDRELDNELFSFLTSFAGNRRMKRKVDSKYGVEGEFFIQDYMESKNDTSIIDRNLQPSTQPSLYCYWIPLKNKKGFTCLEADNFYGYTEWLVYLIDNFLKPKNYILNGEVYYYGERREDFGLIKIVDNKVQKIPGQEIFVKHSTEFDQLMIELAKKEITDPYKMLNIKRDAIIAEIESAYNIQLKKYSDQMFEPFGQEFLEVARIKRKQIYNAKEIILALIKRES